MTTDDRTYCTSFCNHQHRIRDGKPVAHECYIIPPVALTHEMNGATEAAIAAIQAGKKYRVWGELSLKSHSGTRTARKHPPIHL